MTKLNQDINEKTFTEVSGETDPENENKKHFFVIPYVRGISEITASLTNLFLLWALKF